MDSKVLRANQVINSELMNQMRHLLGRLPDNQNNPVDPIMVNRVVRIRHLLVHYGLKVISYLAPATVSNR
jgi:hypothetical protein